MAGYELYPDSWLAISVHQRLPDVAPCFSTNINILLLLLSFSIDLPSHVELVAISPSLDKYCCFKGGWENPGASNSKVQDDKMVQVPPNPMTS